MDEFKRLSACLSYIEANLDQQIEMEQLSTIFCGSKFHFLRMFQIITGFTVAEYIRNRRLTLAAKELTATHVKVIDIALKYGYETPESFSKAFRKMHGISPSKAKRSQDMLKAFPPLSFQITVKGLENMNYKIVEKDAFQVIGKGIRVTMKDEENFTEIPQFWQDIYKSDVGELIESHAGDLGMLGACLEYESEADAFIYFIGVEKGFAEVPEQLEENQIPASTWAVFEVVGPMPEAIQETTKRIFSEWFPATGFVHAGTADIEVYPPQKATPQDADYRTEIWMPVKKA
ncbi:effector binding domain-containing protein [Radiobacillus sp. PE A8.2]|uniref:AraC family transcriptional regulator n=1 Tax=Radiobacillus sp. PE A8.2 TaxID=3380349 RepID=UPI0038901195